MKEKISLSQVSDLISEIEYYESLGYHKLADSILKDLAKIAGRATTQDFGVYGDSLGLSQNLTFFNDYIMSIPACSKLFSLSPTAQAYITQDLGSCMSRKTQEGKPYQQAYEECAYEMGGNHPLLNDDQSKQYIDECMQAIGMMGSP